MTEELPASTGAGWGKTGWATVGAGGGDFRATAVEPGWYHLVNTQIVRCTRDEPHGCIQCLAWEVDDAMALGTRTVIAFDADDVVGGP